MCLLFIFAVGHVCIYTCTSERKGEKLNQMQMLRIKGRHVMGFIHSGSMLCTLSNREKRLYVCLLTLLRVCVREIHNMMYYDCIKVFKGKRETQYAAAHGSP